MKTAYLVCGVPGSGKSWVCNQVKHKLAYVHHDLFIGMAGPTYVNAIISVSKKTDKPLLIEAPFSISQIKEPLEKAGIQVKPVVIAEKEDVYKQRYMNDPKRVKNITHLSGHMTRTKTYLQRAKEFGWFSGTSQEVLEYLQRI